MLTYECVWGCIDGRIAPRSGLAVKSFIDTGAGVVDADYRGPVKVLLFNHSEVDFEGAFPLDGSVGGLTGLCSERGRSRCAVGAGEGMYSGFVGGRE